MNYNLDNLLADSVDITAPKAVEITIREDGKVIWVNVNGVCMLRCCQIETLILNDERRRAPIAIKTRKGKARV